MKEKKVTILLVDDDPEFLWMLTEMITAEGYVVLSAEDGKTAVEKVKSEHPDLILMEQIVTDPNSFKGQFVGKEAIDAQASELTRIMRKVGSTVATKGKVGEEVAAPVSNKQTVAPAVSLPTFNDIQAEIERRKKGAR